MDKNRFAERLGYLASRGMREERHRNEVVAARKQGFEDGVLATLQADDCPHDLDLRCSDHLCGDGC